MPPRLPNLAHSLPSRVARTAILPVGRFHYVEARPFELPGQRLPRKSEVIDDQNRFVRSCHRGSSYQN